jgi:hypothetical protein
MKRLFITKDNLKILVQDLKKTCDEFIAPKKEFLDDITQHYVKLKIVQVINVNYH